MFFGVLRERGVKETKELFSINTMWKFQVLTSAFAVCATAVNWQNVHIGGGGGFTPGIVFHPSAKGVAYARCDIGGLYKLNSDDSWTAITDSLATDAGWYVSLVQEKA